MKPWHPIIYLRVILVSILTLSLCHGADYDKRLTGLASRTVAGSGDATLIAGFIVGPGANKSVVVRALGPALSNAGISDFVRSPHLRLVNSSGVEIASSDAWGADPAKANALRAAFTNVGLQAPAAGSADSALLVSLEPGLYSALVSSNDNTVGTALLEIYDVSGSARLMGLSSRGSVSADKMLMIDGLIVAPGQTRHLVVRACGPLLGKLGVSNFLADPVIEIRNLAGATIASNNDWQQGNSLAQLQADFLKASLTPFPDGSKDAALSIELQPGAYMILVSGNAGSSGVALVEVYDLTDDAISTVNVSASVASTDFAGSAPGVFTFTRSGNIRQALTVSYAVSGSAVSGFDFATLPGQITFPAGITTVTAQVTPLASHFAIVGSRTVSVTLSQQNNYGIGQSPASTVTIFANPGSLYLSSLRPIPAAVGSSVASGVATIQLSSDETQAVVNVSFSNLSSPEVVAHLAVGGPGEDGPYVLSVPNGQVSGLSWTITPSGTFTAADLVNALKSGRIYLSIDSGNFPGGELRGQFIVSSGSQVFTTPAPPPALADLALTAPDASRFLVQATFGPTPADIDALTSRHLADLNAWITAQEGLPPTLHRDATLSDWQTFAQGQNNNASPSGTNRQSAWWKIVLTAPDQLRQRVAFALSEIFVVSDQNSILSNYEEGLANYYDLIAKDAFGNYRQLLEDVATSPVMGIYLSHLRNQKANPVTGTMPDENFAREVMQLFSIGLKQLQPDGTLKLDQGGLPIPTYDNSIITEMARVFTGFSYHTLTPATTSFMGGAADYINPMTLFPTYHDSGNKTIVTGRVLPAGQSGTKDLADALDTLFNHPNTGPFICRQLIQRLVTSNPSPGYVYRVAQVFADNGQGVRGDLGAVVRAILMDYEARSPQISAAPGFGKLKEPILRSTALLRAFSASAGNGRYPITNAYSQLGQAALNSLTVFNFFEPGYVLPGALASAGLNAPEYQILTATTALTTPNFLYGFLYATRSNTAIGLDLSSLLPLAQQPAALVDKLNLLFSAGTLPASTQNRVVTALKALPSSTTDLERVRSATYLVINAPAAAIQK